MSRILNLICNCHQSVLKLAEQNNRMQLAWCQVTLKRMRWQSVRKISINKTRTSRRHLGRSSRAGHHGLDAEETTKKTEVHAWTKICETIHSEPVAKELRDYYSQTGGRRSNLQGYLHCHLKRHLFKLGLVNSRNLERCYDKYEITSQVLLNCNIPAE
jgi:hypothetical protein